MFFGDKMLMSINKILWGIVTISIVIVGIYFSKKLRFVQFNIKGMFESLINSNENKKGINTFSTFLMTLAARIGVGSIAGVALAIYIAGPGSLFWMCIISILTCVISYCETYLGIKYRKKNNDINNGGPFYYIEIGLKNKSLGVVYTILMLITCTFGFISIQANTIIKSMDNLFTLNHLFVGIILSIIIFYIIFRGINCIVKIISALVPFMLLFYFLFAFLIIFRNIDNIPYIFSNIVSSAFNFKSFSTGFLLSFITGIQRGIFSSEAGLGTCTIASSLSQDKDIKKQCLIQMLGVYITSIFVCGTTGLVILNSDYYMNSFSDVNGIEITKYAFSYNIGSIGDYVIFITIFLFSLSSIISCYYDGEVCFKYLGFNNILVLKIITVLIIIIGSISSSLFLWEFIDIFIAIMAIINIYAIFKLKDKIK